MIVTYIRNTGTGTSEQPYTMSSKGKKRTFEEVGDSEPKAGQHL